MLGLIAAPFLALCPLVPAALAAPPEEAWAVVTLKAREVAIHPKTGEQRELSPVHDAELVSPDGARVLFMGTTPGEKTIDLFVADLAGEAGAPRKKNVRALLKGAAGIEDLAWTPDGRDVLFVSNYTDGSQVHLLSSAPPPDGAAPRPRQVSDSSGPCSNARVGADGRIAWRILRERKGKEALYDLVISDGRTPGKLGAPEAKPEAPARPARGVQRQGAEGDPGVPAPPLAPAAEKVAMDAVVAPLAFDALVQRSPVFAFEFSPDASKLAYAAGGSLFIHDFGAKTTREFKFRDVHQKLYAHGMYPIAWRPDGKLVAGFVTFLGGRQVEPGEDPFFIFGDKELFFFPLEGEAWWTARPPQGLGLRWLDADAVPR